MHWEVIRVRCLGYIHFQVTCTARNTLHKWNALSFERMTYHASLDETKQVSILQKCILNHSHRRLCDRLGVKDSEKLTIAQRTHCYWSFFLLPAISVAITRYKKKYKNQNRIDKEKDSANWNGRIMAHNI